MDAPPPQEHDTQFELLSVVLAARPLRAALLVPIPSEVSWHVAFEDALAAQGQVWGGIANIPFPLTPETTDEDLFWALIDILDPDEFVVHAVTNATLERSAPNLWKARRAALEHELAAWGPELRAMELQRWANEPLVPLRAADDFQARLVRHSSPFSFSGHTPNTSSSVASHPDSRFLDLVDVVDEQFPHYLLNCTTSLGELHQLYLTSSRGRCPPRVEAAYSSGGSSVVQRSITAENEWAESCLRGPTWEPAKNGPQDPWAFTLVGASRYVIRPWSQPTTPLIVLGGDVWDYVLYYALSRWRHRVYWVPPDVHDTPEFFLSLYTALSPMPADDPILAVSASDPELLGPDLTSLRDRLGPTRPVTPAHWRTVLPDEPARIYETDSSFHPQAVVGKAGRTHFLPTPIVEQIRCTSPTSAHWVTEVSVDDWMPIRNSRLGQALLAGNQIGSYSARTGRDGIAYLCPATSIFSTSLDVATIRPRLQPMALETQLRTILSEQGATLTTSDKGSFARESARLLGGWVELSECLRDPDVQRVLAGFRATGGNAPGIFLSDDARRYLRLSDLSGRTFTRSVETVLEELEDRDVLTRGLVLKCEYCRATRWHGLGDVDTHFDCGRCRRHQRVHSRTWLGDAEPSWFLSLAEVVFQLLEHNGDLPLLAAGQFVAEEARPVGRAFETEIVGLPGIDSKVEVDMILSAGYRLWIGEATTSDRFADGAAEVRRLRRLRQVADAVDAYGVLLCTSAAAFSERTVGRATAELTLWGREPEYLVGVPTASAMSW